MGRAKRNPSADCSLIPRPLAAGLFINSIRKTSSTLHKFSLPTGTIILIIPQQVMKKRYWLILLTAILFFGGITILNTTVTTSQGVDYKVSRIPLPLYLKILNFYDRHFNLKWLAGQITNKIDSREDKIFRLFEWTHATIHPQPDMLPVMDDHVWNVYVRRYGVSNNFHDLFTTLCNYVGVESYFDSIYNSDHSKKMNFSFVHLNKGWVVFDPYNGVYFKTKAGNWATISDIKNGDWKLEKIAASDISESDYRPFMEKLPDIKKMGLKRANIQSPLNRLKYQLDKWLAGKKPLLE